MLRVRQSRSLHWERGLKLLFLLGIASAPVSLPSLGAWIETSEETEGELEEDSRSLHWERGLKRSIDWGNVVNLMSLPSLGAWIETALQSARP